jgi:hypothetical protein
MKEEVQGRRRETLVDTRATVPVGKGYKSLKSNWDWWWDTKGGPLVPGEGTETKGGPLVTVGNTNRD